MSNSKSDLKIIKPTEEEIKKFSGVVYTPVYKHWQGFANYTINTMTIKDNVVTDQQLGDPYCAMEVLAKLELAYSRLIEKMRRNYPSGFRHV